MQGLIAPAIAAIGQPSALIGLASTAIGTFGKIQAANYQAGIMSRQAALNEQQAKDERMAGQINQQERDMEAAALIERDRLRQSGSGFQLNSTGFQRRTRAMRILARRDAQRIRDDAERKAVGLENQAIGDRASAANFRGSRGGLLLEGLFGGATDLVGGATLVNTRTANRLNRRANDLRTI